MLKFYVRHGIEVARLHTVISFKQSKLLKRYISFITQKRSKAKNYFEKDFYKILNIEFYGKTKKNLRNRIKVEFIRKIDTDKITKHQSKLTFNGVHKSYENCDSYTFKQNEVLMNKPISLAFSVLELSKFLMYETDYDKLQPKFGLENLQLHYMDTDSFLSSVKRRYYQRLKKS